MLFSLQAAWGLMSIHSEMKMVGGMDLTMGEKDMTSIVCQLPFYIAVVDANTL